MATTVFTVEAPDTLSELAVVAAKLEAPLADNVAVLISPLTIAAVVAVPQADLPACVIAHSV